MAMGILYLEFHNSPYFYSFSLSYSSPDVIRVRFLDLRIEIHNSTLDGCAVKSVYEHYLIDYTGTDLPLQLRTENNKVGLFPMESWLRRTHIKRQAVCKLQLQGLESAVFT